MFLEAWGTNGGVTGSRAMPRYFFNVSTSAYFEDLEGTELPDREAALHSAREDIRSLIVERFNGGQVIQPGFIEITDVRRHPFVKVDFADVLKDAGLQFFRN